MKKCDFTGEIICNNGMQQIQSKENSESTRTGIGSKTRLSIGRTGSHCSKYMSSGAGRTNDVSQQRFLRRIKKKTTHTDHLANEELLPNQLGREQNPERSCCQDEMEVSDRHTCHQEYGKDQDQCELYTPKNLEIPFITFPIQITKICLYKFKNNLKIRRFTQKIKLKLTIN